MREMRSGALAEFASPSCRPAVRSCRPIRISLVLRLLWPLFLVSMPVLGSDLESAFDQANRLYEQGNYAEAAAGYQKLIDAGQVSPALYFNAGNAYFKSGRTGEAICYYRLAHRMAPRDPDVRANLRFARETVPGGARHSGRLDRWLNLLSMNELTLGTAAIMWVWFLLLAGGQYRRDLTKSLRPYQLLAGTLTILAVLWLGVLANSRLGSTAAVVVVKEAVVRYGPFDEAQTFFTLRHGSELKVLDRKQQWLQVSDASDRTGWLEAKDVFLLPKG